METIKKHIGHILKDLVVRQLGGGGVMFFFFLHVVILNTSDA